MAKRERVAPRERRRTPPPAAPARRGEPTARARRGGPARVERPGRPRPAPQTGPMPRSTAAPARPRNAAQAKARAKARKAKAPKVVRPPLRQRLLVRLSLVELDPRRLITRVPFVVLVIGALGLGLGLTLWLSTDAAERSYQLGSARDRNQALIQQKEALERDVLEAQAAPALAEAARNLGMIPSRDTAHLVQDPTGAWVVVGAPKPAAGNPPAPLNAPLPDPAPPPPPPAPAPRVVDPRELAVRIPQAPARPVNPEVAVPLGAPVAPQAVPLAPLPAAAPAPVTAPQPAAVPAPDAAALPAPAPTPLPAPAPLGAPAPAVAPGPAA